VFGTRSVGQSKSSRAERFAARAALQKKRRTKKKAPGSFSGRRSRTRWTRASEKSTSVCPVCSVPVTRGATPRDARGARVRAKRGGSTRGEGRALAYLTGAAPGVGTADATARRAERFEAPIDFICTDCPARALRAARLGMTVLVAAVAERPESSMAAIVCVARGEGASARGAVRCSEWSRANLTRKTRFLRQLGKLLARLHSHDTIFLRHAHPGCRSRCLRAEISVVEFGILPMCFTPKKRKTRFFVFFRSLSIESFFVFFLFATTVFDPNSAAARREKAAGLIT